MKPTKFLIVVSECRHEYYDEHDAIVTDIRHAKVTDEHGALRMSCGGFTSVALCEQYVMALMQGIRLAGGEVVAIEWPEADQREEEDERPRGRGRGEREDFHADG